MQNNIGNKEEQDRFSSYMRQRLDEHRMPVDDACWEEIDKKMSRKAPLWGWWIGSMVAAAMVACLIWILPPLQEEIPLEKCQMVELEKSSSKDEATDITRMEPNTLAQQTSIVKSVECLESIVPDLVEATIEPVIDTLKENDEKPKEVTSESPSPSVGKKKYYPEPASSSSIASGYRKEKKKQKMSQTWLIAAIVGTQRNVALPSPGYGLDYENKPPQDLPSGGGGGMFQPTPPVMNPLRPEDFAYANYSVPVSAGITVRKLLNERIGIESGLVYTYLSSRFRQQGDLEAKARLELHYLGIPVNLTVNLWDRSRWNIYISAGFMMEKGLKSVYRLEQADKTHSIDYFEKQSINGLQWSLNAAVGASYRLYKGMSLYAEPHLSYFFDNHQPISSRTDKPLGFGISAGIRFEIK